mmetsp:Transcript_1426/g.2349  ORF Transcript_1426/g.2349 Transcript_1426/m.2349 type:complete len:224 (+) Transcript_1426:2228-2899(+)
MTRGMLHLLHFSRNAKLIFPQLGHFQSPGALPGPLLPGGIGGVTLKRCCCACCGSARTFASFARIIHASAAAFPRPMVPRASALEIAPPLPRSERFCSIARSSWFWSTCSAWPTRCGELPGASWTCRQRHEAACPSGIVRTPQFPSKRSACVCACSSARVKRPLNSAKLRPCFTRRVLGKRAKKDDKCSDFKYWTPPISNAHFAPQDWNSALYCQNSSHMWLP